MIEKAKRFSNNQNNLPHPPPPSRAICQVCSNAILGWSLTFLRQGYLLPHIFVWENVENSFSQNILKSKGYNLQYMIKVAKTF